MIKNVLHKVFIVLALLTSIAEAAEIKEIQVVPESERDLVLRSLPFKKGEEVDSAVLSVAEKLLQAIEKFENVRTHWDPGSGIFRVTVDPVQYIEAIEWTGDRVLDQGDLERKCIRVNEVLPLSQERLSQINRCLVQELQFRGHLDASVLINATSNQLILEAALGPLYTIESIEIEGLDRYQAREMEHRLQSEEGKTFFPEKAKTDTDTIQRGLLKWGYFFAETFQPVIEIDSHRAKVNLRWRNTLGPRFEVRFVGEYTQRKPLDNLIARNETFPKWFVEEMQDQLIADLRSQGYLEAEVIVRRRMQSDGTELIKLVTIKGKRFKIREPEFIGAVNTDKVRKVLNDFDQLKPGAAFNREEYQKILDSDFGDALYEEGYIDLELRGVDFNIDRAKGSVKPIIYVNEGPLYQIVETRWSGLMKWMESLPEFKDLQRLLRLQSPLHETLIEEARNAFKQALFGLGYLDVEVTSQNDKMGPGQISVKVNIELGPQYRIGNVLVRGAKRTNPEILKEESGLEIGEILLADDIRDGIASILRLGIARSLDIRVIEKIPDRNIAFVLIDIVEAARFRFEIGPGYGTLDGLRGVFKGTYANIAGSGRRLSLFAKANRKLNDTEVPVNVLDPREIPFIQRRVTIEYFEPRLLHFPIDGRLTYSNIKQAFARFSDFKNTFTASLDYRINRSILFTSEYDLEYSDPFNVAIGLNTPLFDERAKTLTALTQTVRLEFLDDAFNPVEGWRNKTLGTLFHKAFGGDANFWQTTTKQDFFVALYRVKKAKVLGLALSLNTGFGDPIGPTGEIPVNKRFYVGGETSVRGFDDQSINPPGRVGGNSYFYFQSEINTPVIGGMDFLVFFDGGNLYKDIQSYRPWELRYGAGPGLRWNTPVGPLKVGYGFNLLRRRIDGEREPLGAFYFGVGAL